jgi:hypothetical protein
MLALTLVLNQLLVAKPGPQRRQRPVTAWGANCPMGQDSHPKAVVLTNSPGEQVLHSERSGSLNFPGSHSLQPTAPKALATRPGAHFSHSVGQGAWVALVNRPGKHSSQRSLGSLK